MYAFTPLYSLPLGHIQSQKSQYLWYFIGDVMQANKPGDLTAFGTKQQKSTEQTARNSLSLANHPKTQNSYLNKLIHILVLNPA